MEISIDDSMENSKSDGDDQPESLANNLAMTSDIPSHQCEEQDENDDESDNRSDSEDTVPLMKPYLESSALECPHHSFPCAMMMIQFFEYFGETLVASSVELPTIPPISKLCKALISDCLVDDDDVKLLDSFGLPLCTFLEIRNQGRDDSHDWFSPLESFRDAESSSVSEDHHVLDRLRRLIRSSTCDSPENLKTIFASNPLFRVELFSALIDVAAESEHLRSMHDLRTAKSEEIQSKKSELEKITNEIDDQKEDFAIQTSEEWRESGGFRCFQILGTVEVSLEGTISCEAKEWSPGQDVLEGTHSKVGEQRFSLPSKTARRICVNEACWFPVTAVKRSVLVRGKERAYFQILHESACVSNAYKKLSGQPFEDMGKKETRARLDREVLIAQSAATQGPRQAKKRSEPLGMDSRGRRFWALKSDPNFIFTQSYSSGEENWGFFEGADDIQRLLASLNQASSSERQLIRRINEIYRQAIFPALKEQAKVERIRAIEERAKLKEEIARKRLQAKEECAKAREQFKLSKALEKEQKLLDAKAAAAQKRAAKEKITVESDKPRIATPIVAANLPGLLKCASCGKNAGFRSPFPGILDWVCSDPCGVQLPSQLRHKKILKGYPATGLGFLSSLAISADNDKSSTSSTDVAAAPVSQQHESTWKSAADCIKSTANPDLIPNLSPSQQQATANSTSPKGSGKSVDKSKDRAFSVIKKVPQSSDAICKKTCKFGRALKTELFMMECSSCKVKFHGTCINVSEFDVTDNVLWVCSPNCEDDVPIGLKTTKKVVVGSKKRNAAKKDSPSPDNIPTPQTKSQQHQLCMALCKYKRKASSGQFMVECENCKVWFHGSCMGLCQRDVASDDVIWVCSSQCEDDIPVGSKHEKKLLVGSAVCKSDSCIRSKHHDKAKGAADVPPNVDDEQPLSSQNQLLPSSDEVACRTIQNADHGVSKDQFIESKSDISCDLDSCAKVNSSVEPNEDSNCSVMAGSKRWCIPECRYGRSAECDRFMVECSGCKEWFHGKCVCVRERDVDGEDVLWLCTAACEDEFPANMKVGKRLVIGSLLLDNRKKLDQPNQEESKQDQKLSTCKAETSRKEKRKACSDLESVQNTIIANVEIADRGKSVSKRKRGNICEVSTSCEEKSQGGQESVVIRDSALCKFLGISTGSNSTRSKVNAFVLAYLKRKELLDKSDHMMCLPNDKLRKVFDLPERCTLKKVAKRIKALLVKESDKGSMSTPRTPLARSMLSYESKSPFSNEKGHANLFAEPGIRLFEERSSSVLHETNATFDDEDDDVPLFAANSNQFTYRGQPTADTTSECHAATDSNEQILTSHDAIAVDASSESGCIIRSYSETECHSQVTANSEENTPSADLASLAKADSADNVNAEENERGSVELQCLSDLNHSGCFIPSDSGIELIKKSKESIHLDDLEAQMKAGSDLSDDVDAELSLIASVEHKSVSVSNAEADVLLQSCLKARSTIPSLQSAEAELGGSQMLITHEPETANDMVNVVHHPCRDLVPMQQDCAQQVAVAEEILSEETHQDRADTMVDLEHSVCPLSSSCLDPSEKGASNESIVINKEQGPESRGGANISKAFTLKAADDHAVEEPLKAADDRAVEEPMQDGEDDSVDPSLLEMLEQGALSNAQSADDDDFVSMQDLEMLEAGAASV